MSLFISIPLNSAGCCCICWIVFLIICWLFKKLVKRSFVVLTGLGKHYICSIESKWWSLYQSKKTNISHFFVFSVFSCKTLMEPASCCPRNKSSGQCSTLCLCRSWLTHEESEKSILSQKIVASVFWTLEDSGKGFSGMALTSQDLERSGYCVLVPVL